MPNPRNGGKFFRNRAPSNYVNGANTDCVGPCLMQELTPQSHRAYDQVTTYLRPKNVGIESKS